MTVTPEHTILADVAKRDDTEPTSITEVDAPVSHKSWDDVLEEPTEPDFSLSSLDAPKLEPTPTPSGSLDPVSNAKRSLKAGLVRLPTESEIRAAVDATPTDELPVVTRPKRP